jgi:RNA polymerase sigma-70 factor, ECF subfamily
MSRDDDFGVFYQASYHRLVGQLTVMTGSLEDAEDAVQEAFAPASTRWARLREYETPEAWVRRVALNLATSGLRRTADSSPPWPA